MCSSDLAVELGGTGATVYITGRSIVGASTEGLPGSVEEAAAEVNPDQVFASGHIASHPAHVRISLTRQRSRRGRAPRLAPLPGGGAAQGDALPHATRSSGPSNPSRSPSSPLRWLRVSRGTAQIPRPSMLRGNSRRDGSAINGGRPDESISHCGCDVCCSPHGGGAPCRNACTRSRRQRALFLFACDRDQFQLKIVFDALGVQPKIVRQDQ